MAKRSIKARLSDIAQAIAGIHETLTGVDYETFKSVWYLQRATERGIEIISEASRFLPDDLKKQYTDVDWKSISGIGNVLRHDYQNIQIEVIWNIVERHLPTLEVAVTKMSALPE